MNTGKGKLLIPLIVSVIALLVLVNLSPMAYHNIQAKPDTSTNDQTIWIYQGNRLIYQGNGSTSNTSFGIGTITQDAGEPITYNATIYQPDWEIDGNNLYSGSSYTLDLSPGNYSYNDTRASPALLGYVNLETGLTTLIKTELSLITDASKSLGILSLPVFAGLFVAFFSIMFLVAGEMKDIPVLDVFA